MKVVRKIAVICVFVFIILQACSLQQEIFHEFVITDAETGKVLDSYEYDTGSSQLLRVITYGDNQQASKTIEYTYDADGNIARAIVQRRGLRAIETDVIDYSMREEYDDQNRLIRTIAQGDNGENVETEYIYNDNGKLSEVSQTAADGSLMVMEYKD